MTSYFNPRSPHGERQAGSKFFSRKHYFNPRSPHGERLKTGARPEGGHHISIHAPRTGSDIDGTDYVSVMSISIHAPRTGSDTMPTAVPSFAGYFNPRSPHGERQTAVSASRRPAQSISIHAPRTGSDFYYMRAPKGTKKFQSTLPARGATRSAGRRPLLDLFQSTLPARGATVQAKTVSTDSRHFNPRSPHGERPQRSRKSSAQRKFQSTLPARGATAFGVIQIVGIAISIHAPRTGSDSLR